MLKIILLSVLAVAMIGLMVPSASAELTDSDISIVLNEKYFSHKILHEFLFLNKSVFFNKKARKNIKKMNFFTN